jgi:alcohol dehydrogenase (cytochrome c)
MPISASTLATAGDLVFCGTPGGEFHARTGEPLWRFQTGSGHHSSPITYSVDGRQYVAGPVGWSRWSKASLPG